MNTTARSVSGQGLLSVGARATRATIASACMFLAACANLQPTHTGFLQDYGSLRPTHEQPNEGVFLEPGVDVAHYHAFMLAPVVFEPAARTDIDPVTLNGLKADYREALRAAFDRHLPQTDTPGPDVLIVRAAVTGLGRAHPVVNALTMAAVFVPVTAGAASSEAEVIDSVSGRRLAALQGVTNGGRAFLGGPRGYLSSYGQARRALSRQADQLSEVLFARERARNSPSATTPALSIGSQHQTSAGVSQAR